MNGGVSFVRPWAAAAQRPGVRRPSEHKLGGKLPQAFEGICWMAPDYASIRADNERRYGTDIGRIGPKLLADRYDDRTHFIFEVLQNAEDALARRRGWSGQRSVRCQLNSRELRVSHFGE